ncbi:MAG: ParB N-terminal domain-containing protein [Rhodobacteraceae bacterium]|nr:ParB N-terminal domain-containing protein [Paracoccaceae bacterium]
MRIPLTDIDPNALPRDRTVLDETALLELQSSIVGTGLRQPIEVFANSGDDCPPFGLISGLRRFTVMQRLHQATGLAQYAGIDAILRSPDDIAAALAQMVEENDIRADLTPWERARVALDTHEKG